MNEIIKWLRSVQGNPMLYSDELFKEGASLAALHIKSKLLSEHYKNMLKGGRIIPAMRKKLLYQQLLRVAKQMELLEKKSELRLPEAPYVASPEPPTGEMSPEPPTDETSPEPPTEEASPEPTTDETSPEPPTGETSPEPPTDETSPEPPTGEMSPEPPTGETSPEPPKAAKAAKKKAGKP
jgi:hypothetical protein